MWNHLKLTAFWWLNDMDLLRGILLWKGGRGGFSSSSAAATTTTTHAKTSYANCSVAHLGFIPPFIKDLWFIRGITTTRSAHQIHPPAPLPKPPGSSLFISSHPVRPPPLSDFAWPQLEQLSVETSSTYKVTFTVIRFWVSFIPPDVILFWDGGIGGVGWGVQTEA